MLCAAPVSRRDGAAQVCRLPAKRRLKKVDCAGRGLIVRGVPSGVKVGERIRRLRRRRQALKTRRGARSRPARTRTRTAAPPPGPSPNAASSSRIVPCKSASARRMAVLTRGRALSLRGPACGVRETSLLRWATVLDATPSTQLDSAARLSRSTCDSRTATVAEGLP